MIRVHKSRLPINQKDSLLVQESLNANYVYYDLIDENSLRSFINVNNLSRLTSNVYSNKSNSLFLILNRKLIISENKPLNELTRLDLVNKAKKDTNVRYKNRLKIIESDIQFDSIDINQFLKNGDLIFNIRVKKYQVTIVLLGVVNKLKALSKSQKLTHVNIRSFLMRLMDKEDIKINCTCPDFKYRFAYTATQNNFKANNLETRPSTITNPDEIGSACKHILHFLTNKRWIRKYVSLINLLIKLNPKLMR